ncbi:hypothetical protein HPB51_012816 [Rhipicephalus microplus]|uniref:TRAF1-6 MATH domain-containing protein n=1 Tax=Rhipicephalus microplus TaxID=6941 RepID=A0A9J6EAG0_RHIMP|nr:uncharacterized protein LOC119163659 [Rhipicephalus microplus]XP_037271603.1 uncharacterized protein LOC119163659 [Rhipicephalus microplus]KAH8031096.1 hypothetical protein HPB51_012816 [Rhipicephalus microplus]
MKPMGREYRMTGFGDFLEWRILRFAEPLPKIRVCGLCGVVAAVVKLLPCTHVLCECCEGQAIDGGRLCPIEGASFAGEELQTLPFSRRDLGERQVFCFNNTGDGEQGRGCDFAGKLEELERHFVVECFHGLVRCSKCSGEVARKDAYEHYVGCVAGDDWSASGVSSDGRVNFVAEDVARLAAALRDIREGLKKTSLNDPAGDSKLAALRHRADSLANFLDFLDPGAESGDDEADGQSQRFSWCDSETGTATICKFSGVASMRKTDDPLLRLGKPHVLDGYTFNLACKFNRSWGKLTGVTLLFALCAGDKDDVLDWPFARRVTLSIAHTKREGSDIRVPLKTCPEKDGAECLKRPRADAAPKWIHSEKVSWKQVEKNGLVHDDCLFVAVAFE